MTYREAKLAAIRAYWTDLLKKHGYNVTAAAREAGVLRRDVYRYVKHYGVPFRRLNKGEWDRGPVLPTGPHTREMRL